MAGNISDENWTMLAKYLVSEVTVREKAEAEALLNSNKELRADFHKLMGFYYFNWENNEVNPTEAFKKLHQRIEQ